MKWNQLKKSIKENAAVWIIFGMLVVSNWKFAFLFWLIPFLLLFGFVWRKEGKIDEQDWENIITPVTNFYLASAIILCPVIEWIDKIKNHEK